MIKAFARPWVTRFLQPRIAQTVRSAFDEYQHVRMASMKAMSKRLDGLDLNAEMLQAEVAAVAHELELLVASVTAMGMAIAPTAGLDGVPDRLAELRERLNAVERRTRTIVPREEPAQAAGDAGVLEERTESPSGSAAIDYVGFERRFRGDPDKILEVTRERYLQLLQEHAPVLDVGCGKGELIEALVRAGIAAVGIDLDPAMVDEARVRGLDVHVADLNSFLEKQPPRSLGSIISTQVVEHLQVEHLVRFLDLSVSRLRPGGLFVAETPNPASLIVLGTHFILDPTHVRPIHPALMVYLCECAGFRSVELRFYEPASQYHLAMIADDETSESAKLINENFTRINDVLFGPQDYAVVARTPS
jgi:2-polyprenyl-3-methyl-5-hydroxy-6-metoxy-1,4-benzoquinol methylase